jgi:hypothetical protein
MRFFTSDILFLRLFRQVAHIGSTLKLGTLSIPQFHRGMDGKLRTSASVFF